MRKASTKKPKASARGSAGQRQMGLRLRRRPRRGQGRHAQSARRQGRGPCRNGQSRPAGAARLHHHHRGLHLLLRHDKQYPKDLKAQVEKALAQVGKITGKTFGDKTNPLLVSVRSGARASMPGMMDTVLNLGLNDETVEALAKKSGDRRFAYDSYRRFITMYSDVVLGVGHEHFEELLDHHKERQGYTPRHRSDRRRLGRAGRALQEARQGGARQAVSRRTRTSNCGARSAPCSAPG